MSFPFSRRTTIFLIILLIVSSAIVFFTRWSSFEAAKTMFRNNQALYAEVPIVSPSVMAASTAKGNVPILVYHIVRPSSPTDSRGVIALAQTPAVFDAQMKYLKEAGYEVISFATLENSLQKGTPLPPHPILISFDDGWSDQFTYAFPILEKYKYPATFFVFTNPIGSRGFLTWDDLRTMRDAGMTIGSHTRSHPFLTKITDPAILWNEIDGSKQRLEENLGITVTEFAYPFGQYNATTTAAVEKAGYKIARGDYLEKGKPVGPLYEVGALNAPTTTALFMQKFPPVE